MTFRKESVRRATAPRRIPSPRTSDYRPISLPPDVSGDPQGKIRLCVDKVNWKPAGRKLKPGVSLVRVKWWGERGPGAIFRLEARPVRTSIYPVNCSKDTLTDYFKDARTLVLDLVNGASLLILGHALVPLSAVVDKPLDSTFGVVSASDSTTPIASLHVSLSCDIKPALPPPASPEVPFVTATESPPEPLPQQPPSSFLKEEFPVDSTSLLLQESTDVMLKNRTEASIFPPARGSPDALFSSLPKSDSVRSLKSQEASKKEQEPHSEVLETLLARGKQLDSAMAKAAATGHPHLPPSAFVSSSTPLSPFLFSDSVGTVSSSATTIKESPSIPETFSSKTSKTSVPFASQANAQTSLVDVLLHSEAALPSTGSLSDEEEQLLQQLFFRKTTTGSLSDLEEPKEEISNISSPYNLIPKELTQHNHVAEVTDNSRKASALEVDTPIERTPPHHDDMSSELSLSLDSFHSSSSSTSSGLSLSPRYEKEESLICLLVQLSNCTGLFPKTKHAMSGNLIVRAPWGIHLETSPFTPGTLPFFEFHRVIPISPSIKQSKAGSQSVMVIEGWSCDGIIGLAKVPWHSVCSSLWNGRSWVAHQSRATVAFQGTVEFVSLPSLRRCGEIEVALALGTQQQLRNMHNHTEGVVTIQAAVRSALQHRHYQRITKQLRQGEEKEQERNLAVQSEKQSVLALKHKKRRRKSKTARRFSGHPMRVYSKHRFDIEVSKLSLPDSRGHVFVSYCFPGEGHCLCTPAVAISGNSRTLSATAEPCSRSSHMLVLERGEDVISTLLSAAGAGREESLLEFECWLDKHDPLGPERLGMAKLAAAQLRSLVLHVERQWEDDLFQTSTAVDTSDGEADGNLEDECQEGIADDVQTSKKSSNVCREFCLPVLVQSPVMNTFSSSRIPRPELNRMLLTLRVHYRQLILHSSLTLLRAVPLVEFTPRQTVPAVSTTGADHSISLPSRIEFSVSISRANLKDAVVHRVNEYPSLRAASHLGPNPYVTVTLLPGHPPLCTPVLAQTFEPNFSFESSIQLCLDSEIIHHMTSSEAVFDVWHRIPLSAGQKYSTILLGTCSVPLSGLFDQDRAICGYLPLLGPNRGKPVGALEIAIRLRPVTAVSSASIGSFTVQNQRDMSYVSVKVLLESLTVEKFLSDPECDENGWFFVEYNLCGEAPVCTGIMDFTLLSVPILHLMQFDRVKDSFVRMLKQTDLVVVVYYGKGARETRLGHLLGKARVSLNELTEGSSSTVGGSYPLLKEGLSGPVYAGGSLAIHVTVQREVPGGIPHSSSIEPHYVGGLQEPSLENMDSLDDNDVSVPESERAIEETELEHKDEAKETGNELLDNVATESHISVSVERAVRLPVVFSASSGRPESRRVSVTLDGISGPVLRTSYVLGESPHWDHTQQVPIRLLRQPLVFSVWHQESSDSPSKAQLLGVSEVPLDGLCSLGELYGWYNVFGAKQQPQGQLLLRVIPDESIRLGRVSFPSASNSVRPEQFEKTGVEDFSVAYLHSLCAARHELFSSSHAVTASEFPSQTPLKSSHLWSSPGNDAESSFTWRGHLTQNLKELDSLQETLRARIETPVFSDAVDSSCIPKTASLIPESVPVTFPGEALHLDSLAASAVPEKPAVGMRDVVEAMEEAHIALRRAKEALAPVTERVSPNEAFQKIHMERVPPQPLDQNSSFARGDWTISHLGKSQMLADEESVRPEFRKTDSRQYQPQSGSEPQIQIQESLPTGSEQFQPPKEHEPPPSRLLTPLQSEISSTQPQDPVHLHPSLSAASSHIDSVRDVLPEPQSHLDTKLESLSNEASTISAPSYSRQPSAPLYGRQPSAPLYGRQPSDMIHFQAQQGIKETGFERENVSGKNIRSRPQPKRREEVLKRLSSYGDPELQRIASIMKGSFNRE